MAANTTRVMESLVRRRIVLVNAGSTPLGWRWKYRLRPEAYEPIVQCFDKELKSRGVMGAEYTTAMKTLWAAIKAAESRQETMSNDLREELERLGVFSE